LSITTLDIIVVNPSFPAKNACVHPFLPIHIPIARDSHKHNFSKNSMLSCI